MKICQFKSINMEKILNFSNNICLFCGEEEKKHWDEYESYLECDCKDAKLDRSIDDQICKLKPQRPKKKFTIVQKPILYKVED